MSFIHDWLTRHLFRRQKTFRIKGTVFYSGDTLEIQTPLYAEIQVNGLPVTKRVRLPSRWFPIGDDLVANTKPIEIEYIGDWLPGMILTTINQDAKTGEIVYNASREPIAPFEPDEDNHFVLIFDTGDLTVDLTDMKPA